MHKLYFQTHGCSTNFAESEMMMGLLVKAGFKIAETANQADIAVINVCTVKGEFTALREVRKFVEQFPKKKLVISGCITPELVKEIREITEDASLISTHHLTEIVSLIEEAINGNIIEAVSFQKGKKLCLPRIRKNPIVGIIPILSGCNNECAYCSVRLIKGTLESFPKEDILKEVHYALHQGCKELWITSQDNAAYGTEIIWRSALPELLKEILAIQKNFKLRLGMMNLNNVRQIADELIEIYKDNKMFRFLHIPLQSGNDAILGKMNRGYTYNEFREIIVKFKEKIPDLAFATDVIVGFPSETDEQFQDTLNAIRELNPDIVNISRFIPRQGTKAYSMDGQIQDDEIKRRSRIVTDIFSNLSALKNEAWLGWQGEILIEEKGKEDTWIGRNSSYKQVIVSGNYRLGQVLKVNVAKAATYHLKGEELK